MGVIIIYDMFKKGNKLLILFPKTSPFGPTHLSLFISYIVSQGSRLSVPDQSIIGDCHRLQGKGADIQVIFEQFMCGMNDFIRLLRLNIKMCTLSIPAVSEKVKVICLKVVGNVMCRVADRVPATLAIRMVPEIRLR